jgi:hypothetical protein
MKYNAAQFRESSLLTAEDYTVNIGGAAITSIITAKTELI